ncbi:Aryl hydrocarbon receptor nuclear translocator-like protein 2 [Taenia solium]|eukprot:TsM_000276200 transcript=TsM_000276200 gene=TsM_000276200
MAFGKVVLRLHIILKIVQVAVAVLCSIARSHCIPGDVWMAEGSKRLIKCRPSGFVSRDWQASRVRFTHNEIERKRRARLKSETDFLHQQLPNAVYRDKLAVFKAGTELLMRYSNLNGSEARNLILTDNEYSECVLNNFDGFGMRIRCSDAVILMATKNLKCCLGSDLARKTLTELVSPSELAEGIIKSNLSLTSEERDQLASGQSIARTFILPIVDVPKTSADSSRSGYRLLECCGDIVLLPCSNQNGNEPVLQAICRILEHHLPNQTAPKGKLFSLRLQPDSHLIVELHGHALPTGMSPCDMVGHSLVDLALPTDRSVIESNLHNAERTGEATFTIYLGDSSLNSAPMHQFLVVAKAIVVCNCLHCLVADFYPPQQ